MVNMTKTVNPINITFTDEDYENYLRHRESYYPPNSRIRPDDMDFLDALLSVDMTDTPEGRELLEAISKLN
jgi:hypothetical protein